MCGNRSIKEIYVPFSQFVCKPKTALRISLKKLIHISGQDGGVSRYTLPPCTTKRTTNWKQKNNQNCQKTELYESLTTKELKKHSSTLVGRAETGSLRRGLGARPWLANPVVPHLRANKLGRTTGEQDRPRYPGFQCREIKPQNL